MSVGEHVLVVLRFDLDAFDPLHLLQAGHVDLVVEMPDVADYHLVLHLRHVLRSNDVLVAGRCDEDVGGFHDILESRYLIAFHCRLQRADRIDLRNHHSRTLATESLCASLADITVAADNGDLAREHHIGRP